MTAKKLNLILCLILFSAVSFGFPGCDETQEIRNWIENTSRLKVAALWQIEKTPYRNLQHKAFKDYFAELGNVALALKNDADFAERFNVGVAKTDLKVACAKIFLEKKQWQSMMDKCMRNRFFLCPEEVRAYPDFISALRVRLSKENQKRFDETASCKAGF